MKLYVIYLREWSSADPACVFISSLPQPMTTAEVTQYMRQRYGTRAKRIVLEMLTGTYAEAKERAAMYAALNDCDTFPSANPTPTP